MASALETRLLRDLPPTFAERDALGWLERRQRSFDAGEVVLEQGQETA